ncbi:Crp/Fnr family transcriptional regulator [Nocardioides sp. LHG3406-4]|uniref:Crp/Fnr family transcriptional regulator n=1 Tax=Nocardioides sp. LHG3406-4 TaxID=2804575 RepID=UPI003CF09D2A
MAAAGGHEGRLAGVELFAGLSGRQLKALVKKSREVHHPAGKVVTAEGLGGLAFHLILEGTATVSKAGHEIRTLGPGDHFGEISMIDGRPRSATVTTNEPLTALAVPHASFEELLDEDPGFARVLLRSLCARLRERETSLSGD